MKTKVWLACVVSISMTLLAAPVLAQSPGSTSVCTGGTSTVEPGTSVGSLALFGCSGIVKSGGTVTGDAIIVGGTLHVEQGGRVNRAVAVLGGSAVIDGEIGGDVSVAGGSVVLSDSAIVNGNVRIAGGSVQRAGGATVRGTVSQENNPRAPGAPLIPGLPPLPGSSLRPFIGDFSILRGVLSALAFAALGAVLVALFPTAVRRVTETAEHQFVPSVGVGCLTVIVSLFGIVALVITIIGIPVVILLAVVEAAAWCFGWVSVGTLLGERMLAALNARNATPVLAVVVGVLVIALLGQVPLMGGVISLLVGLLGLGAVVLTRFGSRSYPSWSPLPQPVLSVGTEARAQPPTAETSSIIVPSPGARPDESTDVRS